MSYIRIWIHLVFSTKNRDKIITPGLKAKLLKHIKENAKKKNIYIDFINCVSDHVHVLLSLGADQTISKIVHLIKGESSHWVNKENLTAKKFEWQEEYFAASISESQVNTIRDYIKNQEEHHKKKSFNDEYELFLRKYGFERK